LFFTTGGDLQTALALLPPSQTGSYTPFDSSFYQQQYLQGYLGSLSPIQHFVQIGADLNFMPNSSFDPAFYKAHYADLANTGFNAADLLYHFMQYGLNEGRAPNALLTTTFDGLGYLAAYPAVAAYVNSNLGMFNGSQTNGAIAHYVKFGQFQGFTIVTFPEPGQTFTLTADAPTVTEGNSGTKTLIYTLTLDKEPTESVTVNYQTLTSGTATAGDDFNAAAGIVNFAAGQTVATVSVTVNGDTNFEADETIAVKFSSSKLVADVTATGTITNDDVDLSTQAQTFTLTKGADTIPGMIGSNGTTGTDGNDTISAIVENSASDSTLNSTDSLNTGNGADILNVRVISLTAPLLIAPVLTSVDKVSVSSTDQSGNPLAIDLASATGTSAVEFKNNSALSDTTFLNAAPNAVITLDNADGSSVGQNVNLGSAAGRTGNSDAFSINIANGTGSDDLAAGFNLVSTDGTTDDTSFEIANINVSGAPSFVVVGEAMNGLTTVNVTGETTGVASDGFGLELTQVRGFGSLATVNAAGMTGGGLAIAPTETTATGFSFIGSNSADALVLATTALNSSGTLNGGGGKDTLATTSFANVSTAVNRATGFEVLAALNPVSNLDASSFSKINEFLFEGGSNNGRLNITGVESNDRFVFADDQGSSDETVRFTAAAVGESVLLEMRASSEAGGEIAIVANDNGSDEVGAIGFRSGVSSVTIDSTGQNSAPNLIQAVDNGRDLYYAFKNDNGLANFKIIGSQSLTIGPKEGDPLSSNSKTVGFFEAANVDASEFTGALRISGSRLADVIKGGSGNDIIYGLSGNDNLTGNGGSDQFRMVGTGGTDSIKDFLQGTDKIGINNVDFSNTTATSAGATLSALDYVDNRSGITSIGAADDKKVIELQTALSTSQIQTDAGAAVEAYVLVFNSTTNKAELWFDEDWSDAGRSHVATFDNVTDLVGLIGFQSIDFVEFIA
jgi:hypothetical protein